MKIAFVSTIKSVPWGGSEELWYLMAKYALEKNCEIGCFVYNWAEEPMQLNDLRKRGSKIFKREKGTSFKKRALTKLFSLLSVNRLHIFNPYSDLKKFNPDFIVITDGIYYTADDIWLRIVLNNFHNRYIIISQGNSAYSRPSDRNTTIDLFEKAKLLVFVAESNRKLTFHQLAHKFSNTTIIQNPVNLKSFSQCKMPDFHDGIIHCAVVGRLCISDKGQDMLIEMMALDYWRISNLVIHIFGVGQDKEYIEKLIKFYNLEEKVLIEGHKDIDEVWKLCHCLLMPSLQEGTPLTLLEAFVYGRVCVVTDVGGNAEWVSDGQNGYLVEAPTVDLFSKKLKQAVENVSNWNKIVDNAYTTIISRIDKTPGQTLLDKIIYNK